MNKIVKIPFYGKEMVAVEKDGKMFVAMKPVVEAMGLIWRKQIELIKRDPVLRTEGITITEIPSNGGPQEMFCLPLEYLNGWLFKVPASRYSGERRKTIEFYQKECYKALYDYWHNGGAVNPRLNEQQATKVIGKVAKAGEGRFDDSVSELIKKVYTKLEDYGKSVNTIMQRNVYLENFHPKGVPYEVSKITGRPKDRFVPGYYSSNRKAKLLETLSLIPELPGF